MLRNTYQKILLLKMGFLLGAIGLVLALATTAFAADSDDFVITVQTDISDASKTTYALPIFGGEVYNYNVDCDNDGINDATGLTGDYTCSYPTPGQYTIRIKDNTGTNTGFPRVNCSNSGNEQLVGINQWGTSKWTTMQGAFRSCYNLNGAGGFATDSPDLSNVTDMNSMFDSAISFNQDISAWNTANVTDMSYMFAGATSFDQNLGTWDMSNVSYATNMFNDVTLSTTNYDALLNGWDAQTLQSGVLFSGGSSTYCSGEAARNDMINTYGWNIMDQGKDCSQ